MLKKMPRRLGNLVYGVEVADLGDGGSTAGARLRRRAISSSGVIIDGAVELPVRIGFQSTLAHGPALVADQAAVEPDVLGESEMLDQPAKRQHRWAEAHRQLVAVRPWALRTITAR